MNNDVDFSKLSDDELSKFALDRHHQYISDAVAPEMIKRLKKSIDKFDESSTRYSKKIFWLTAFMGMVAFLQLVLVAFQIYLIFFTRST